MKDIKKVSMNLPVELFNYLKTISENNYQTMTQYIIELLKKDKGNTKTKETDS